jgi:hypothetical protein
MIVVDIHVLERNKIKWSLFPRILCVGCQLSPAHSVSAVIIINYVFWRSLSTILMFITSSPKILLFQYFGLLYNIGFNIPASIAFVKIVFSLVPLIVFYSFRQTHFHNLVATRRWSLNGFNPKIQHWKFYVHRHNTHFRLEWIKIGTVYLCKYCESAVLSISSCSVAFKGPLSCICLYRWFANEIGLKETFYLSFYSC